jgi:predicted nucleic acid-binding protein
MNLRLVVAAEKKRTLRVRFYCLPGPCDLRDGERIWKHRRLIRDIPEEAYLKILFNLAASERVSFFRPNTEVFEMAFDLAKKYRVSVYDTVFVASALALTVRLMTFDKEQDRIYLAENSR